MRHCAPVNSSHFKVQMRTPLHPPNPHIQFEFSLSVMISMSSHWARLSICWHSYPVSFSKARLWEPMPSLHARRYRAAAVASQGRLYVVGGCDGSWHTGLRSVEVFEPELGVWRILAPLQQHPSETTRGGKTAKPPRLRNPWNPHPAASKRPLALSGRPSRPRSMTLRLSPPPLRTTS